MASAAAGAGANATVQAGGKRKPVDLPVGVHAAKRDGGAAAAPVVDATHVQTGLDLVGADQAMEFVRFHRDDDEDDVPDNVDVLRRAITALPQRYLSCSTRPHVDAFLKTLTLPTDPSVAAEYPLTADVTAGVFEMAPFSIIREMSLLLRLFVALGGHLNGNVQRAVDGPVSDDVKAGSDKGGTSVPQPTAVVDRMRDQLMVSAILIAGRRLRINWHQFCASK